MGEAEYIPSPEPGGQLAPPPRKPPTAVGLAEPSRGKPHPDRPMPPRMGKVSRASRIMLGALLVAGGAGLSLTSPMGFLVGGAGIAAGASLIGRTMRGQPNRRLERTRP